MNGWVVSRRALARIRRPMAAGAAHNPRMDPACRSRARAALALLALTLLVACSGPAPAQAPDAYLDGALDWLQEHALYSTQVDWTAVRQEARALVPHLQTTADTYPAIWPALRRLGAAGDGNAFLLPPGGERRGPGFAALYPGPVVMGVEPGSPAEQAGLHVGDVVEQLNGLAPVQRAGTWFMDEPGGTDSIQLTLRRVGHAQPVTISFTRTDNSPYHGTPHGQPLQGAGSPIAYLQLPWTPEEDQYATAAQQALRTADQPAACGWIIDLRKNIGGDIWAYLAAVGPILGEGEVGGFVYPDGKKELWTYRDGQVLWAGNARHESRVDGDIYAVQRPQSPVALLTSRATYAAGELVMVAFQGRPQVRTFGEPTGGNPFLQLWTWLSDNAVLNVSGAYAMDRTGRVYQGPLTPDQTVTTDWMLFGTERDPVISVARAWLRSQPGCTP